jgi:hypothetical protein
MVVMTHTADDCPLNNREIREKSESNSKRTADVAKSLGITSKGYWMNLLNHTVYILLDAPNDHVISQMLLNLHYLDWNIAVVNPVITPQELSEMSKKTP